MLISYITLSYLSCRFIISCLSSHCHIMLVSYQYTMSLHHIILIRTSLHLSPTCIISYSSYPSVMPCSAPGAWNCLVRSRCPPLASRASRMRHWSVCWTAICPPSSPPRAGSAAPTSSRTASTTAARWVQRWPTWQPLRLKPWSNGPPISSQLEPSSQLRRSWVSFGHPLGSSWLKFDQAQIFAKLEPSFPPFGQLSQLRPTLTKLFCYRYVTTRSYWDNWMVSWKLARIGSTVWPPANASFDFVTCNVRGSRKLLTALYSSIISSWEMRLNVLPNFEPQVGRGCCRSGLEIPSSLWLALKRTGLTASMWWNIELSESWSGRRNAVRGRNRRRFER